jgi:hypothetical protein
LNMSRKSNKKCVKDRKQNCAGGGAVTETVMEQKRV